MVLSREELPAIISSDQWHIYKDGEFTILHDYDKYALAEKAVRKASMDKDIGSNLETEIEEKRTVKRPSRFEESEDSESSNQPRKKCHIKPRKRIRQNVISSDDSACDGDGDHDDLEILLSKQKDEMQKKSTKNSETTKDTTVKKLISAGKSLVNKNNQSSSSVKVPNATVDNNRMSPDNSARKLLSSSGASTSTLNKNDGGSLNIKPRADPSKDTAYLSTLGSSPRRSSDPGLNSSNPRSPIHSVASNNLHEEMEDTSEALETAKVSSYIKGCKGNKIFTFGEAQSFQEAAPALEHVLSALLNMFHDVSSKQDFIMFNVQTIVSKVCPEEEVIERPEGMPPIPLKSFENISLMDGFLSEKRHRRALVTMMYSKIRAVSDVETAARNLLSFVFHNEGARLVSWCGTSGLKFKFKDSNICTVVESVLLKRYPTGDSLQKGYNAIKKWFNTAFQRVASSSKL